MRMLDRIRLTLPDYQCMAKACGSLKAVIPVLHGAFYSGVSFLVLHGIMVVATH